jgi:hypothetical protein
MSGDCGLPIDFNLKFGIETPLCLLMKSSTLKSIPIGPGMGLDVNGTLEDGWSLLFLTIPSHSVAAVLVCADPRLM